MVIGRRGEALRADGLADVGVRGDADGLVELALRLPELHGHEQLGLGRQLLGDVALEAPQHVRRHRLAQRREALGVAPLLDGLPPEAPERQLVAEQARREPVEDRPQLAQVVLDGRPRQAHAVLGVQPLDGPARLAAGVLDGLRLVEDHDVEPLLGEAILVANDERGRS